MEEVQVLFEYKESRRQLTVSPAAICEVVAEELGKFGYAAPVVKLSGPESESISQSRSEYLLQRWSQRWDAFVDVERVEDIKSRDRITVIPKPSYSQVGNLMDSFSSLLNIIFVCVYKFTCVVSTCVCACNVCGEDAWPYNIPSQTIAIES